MENPKSLAIAWEVQRKNRATSPSSTPRAAHVELEEEADRPASLAEAILAKRKAAMPEPELPEEPLEDDGYGEPFPEEEIEAVEPDISAPPKRLPFPTNRAESIRAKLKAKRGF